MFVKGGERFPFLIGTVRTKDGLLRRYSVLAFPFLIGTVRTVQGKCNK